MDNRNLYGFALFTLILITTVFVKFALFTPKSIIKSPSVYVETATGTKTNCFPKITKPVSAPVDIATLNLRNRIFDLSLDLNRQLNFETHNGFAITLHFFTKDSAEPRKLAAETLRIQPGMVNDAANFANVRLTCSYYWLSRLKPNQSLYVISRVAASQQEAKNLAVDFNDAEATPVLLIAGKE